MLESSLEVGLGVFGACRRDAVSIRTIVKGAQGLFSAMQQTIGPQATREERVIRYGAIQINVTLSRSPILPLDQWFLTFLADGPIKSKKLIFTDP